MSLSIPPRDGLTGRDGTPGFTHSGGKTTRRRLLQNLSLATAAVGLAAPGWPSVGPDSGGDSATEPSDWSLAEPLPIAIQELYPAVHGNRLYVAGGIAARLGVPYFTNRCFSFDARSNDWREEAGLPEDLHHAALASNSNQLLLAGGFNGGYSHIWRMRAAVYQLSDTGWEPSVALPRPQAEGVLAADQRGAFHLVTGQSPRGEGNASRDDHREVNDHWVLSEGASSWEALAPIPTPRNSATGGWVNDQLIVTGGRTAQGNLDATEIYDLKEDRWRTAAPLPAPQAGTASVVSGDSLLVFGGEIFVPEARVFASCWRYQLSTDQWEPLPDMRTPRHGLGAGVLGERVYVFGGATRPSGRGTSALNESLPLSRLSI